MSQSMMIQGTASNVGKSVLVAAFCRIFKEMGIRVAPFKPQNMALNSFVTEEGMEIGRAQAVQAEASGLKPHVDMNPILLKPSSDTGAQVILQGKVYRNLTAREYQGFKNKAKEYVQESFDRLCSKFDLIVIEGAGSPAEINLRENDIANMGTAHLVDAPVILVGDIDKGGVFASLVGTLELLDEADKKRIKGFIINKFRGDVSLLQPGIEFLEKKTGLPVFGVIPYFTDIYVQEEDGVTLKEKHTEMKQQIRIIVIRLPHISNFTDFDPFLAEEDVSLKYTDQVSEIRKADILILPGTKNTISDLRYLKTKGLFDTITQRAQSGCVVIGICGGFQMLGNSISDPDGIESLGKEEGFSLLQIKTELRANKETHQIKARPMDPRKGSDITLEGYEIHMGNTEYMDQTKPLFRIQERGGNKVELKDGAQSKNGKVWGSYIHGFFENGVFRKQILDEIRREKGFPLQDQPSKSYADIKEEGFKKLAELVRKSVDMDLMCRSVGFAI